MPFLKRIVCLANSRRPGGSCLAGKEVLTPLSFGSWIRPVPAGLGHALKLSDRRYAGGGEPGLLDILEVSIDGHQPLLHQIENFTLTPNHAFRRRGTLAFDAVPLLADDVETIWVNGHDSYNGVNDQVPEAMLAGLGSSLLLVKPENLRFEVGAEWGDQTKARAVFEYRGVSYRLALTDPAWEAPLKRQAFGAYVPHRPGPVWLTVSLSEPFNGHAYKLAAGVIQAP